MLQYPINVYPDNVTIDKADSHNDRSIHYTFKGDILKAYVVRFINYDTGNVVTNDAPVYDFDSENLVFRKLAFNNDTVTHGGLIPLLPSVGNYVMQMMLIAGTNSGAGVQADRFVLRGTLQDDYVSGSTSMTLEDKINNIYEWDLNVTNIRSPFSVTESGNVYDLNVMFIKINGVTAKITSYDYNTGVITLAQGFYNNIPKGTPYQIYCNYLITSQYYFSTAPLPQVTNMNATFDAYGIHFTASYSQPQNLPLKYYNITMQKKTDSDVYHTIAQTENIYSVDIKYDFVDDYDFAGIGGNDTTRKYRFIVNTVSQDGVMISGVSSDITAPERTNTDIIDSISVNSNMSYNAIYVDWTVTQQVYRNYRVYRIDADENYGVNPQKLLVADIRSSTGFFDMTASTQKRYKYMVVPYNGWVLSSTEIDNAVLSDVAIVNKSGYSITAITDSGKDVNGKPFYLIGDTWIFTADIDNTTVTQNTDKTLHVGFGRYSSITSTNVNYMTGSVSGMLGTIDCSGKKFDDGIKVVEAWRDFITQNCQFILRSQKGDVWIVNITDNPTTEYDEKTANIPTRFNFSWAECCSVGDILTGDSLPVRYSDRE